MTSGFKDIEFSLIWSQGSGTKPIDVLRSSPAARKLTVIDRSLKTVARLHWGRTEGKGCTMSPGCPKLLESAEKIQECCKFFLQYSTFTPERA